MVNVTYAASAAATLAGAAYDYVIVGGGNVFRLNHFSSVLIPIQRHCRTGSRIAVCMISFCLNASNYNCIFIKTY